MVRVVALGVSSLLHYFISKSLRSIVTVPTPNTLLTFIESRRPVHLRRHACPTHANISVLMPSPPLPHSWPHPPPREGPAASAAAYVAACYRGGCSTTLAT